MWWNSKVTNIGQILNIVKQVKLKLKNGLQVPELGQAHTVCGMLVRTKPSPNLGQYFYKIS